jgi:DNA-binding MarR family transcriptional regulator
MSAPTAVGRLPLSTLLSQALVAFTVEFDNEAESQVAHWTTDRTPAGARHGVWLASQAMWANFMRFIPDDGVRLRDLEALARLTNLNGLIRWGYVELAPDPADERADISRSDFVLRPTRAGRRAQGIWRPLGGEIERRWQDRFGTGEIGGLKQALGGFATRSERPLPAYLPVAGYGMRLDAMRLQAGALQAASEAEDDLSSLLAKVLLMFTLDFEAASKLSLPISANALRVLDELGVRLRDLTRLTGVSKEAIAMSLGVLEKLGCTAIEQDPSASRGKLARLTEKGQQAKEHYRRVLAGTQASWEERFGAQAMAALRAPLEALVADGGPNSPLLALLPAYPDGWRADLAKPETLPHHPMVLHRGGWPDGS